MHTVYTLHANELDMRFIESLKALFGERKIEIAVCEASEREDDEADNSRCVVRSFLTPKGCHDGSQETSPSPSNAEGVT